jgi:hypothetical protein
VSRASFSYSTRTVSLEMGYWKDVRNGLKRDRFVHLAGAQGHTWTTHVVDLPEKLGLHEARKLADLYEAHTLRCHMFGKMRRAPCYLCLGVGSTFEVALDQLTQEYVTAHPQCRTCKGSGEMP